MKPIKYKRWNWSQKCPARWQTKQKLNGGAVPPSLNYNVLSPLEKIFSRQMKVLPKKAKPSPAHLAYKAWPRFWFLWKDNCIYDLGIRRCGFPSSNRQMESPCWIKKVLFANRVWFWYRNGHQPAATVSVQQQPKSDWCRCSAFKTGRRIWDPPDLTI